MCSFALYNKGKKLIKTNKHENSDKPIPFMMKNPDVQNQ